MKKFEAPMLTMDTFEVEDIITTSGNENACPQDGCPVDAGEFSLR